ncbi:hypothetical protein [Mumia zhuanghuii]|nr:hypothetical protein [Mumia zhuanghuii]
MENELFVLGGWFPKEDGLPGLEPVPGVKKMPEVTTKKPREPE